MMKGRKGWTKPVQRENRMQSLELYEKKIISDPEFPVSVFINKAETRKRIFSPHWHEHVELHYVMEGKTRIRRRFWQKKEIWWWPTAMSSIPGTVTEVI